ncbi:MAG: zinc-binding dehydrogenase [Rubrobacteraceae bacterium]|uniref:zinc-binding dehydrogenase n=1 Tax=Rubrobacter naiadicus TaxID=1392641 RepID=UPI002362BA43|nr:zinc-binding dehydrogenase [Rubrobacter naiadicus]MBX6762530.1 zinc-binding dehydrogenase [Rubrobacteraceae bacterium]
MKAVILRELGGPESLAYEEAPDPEPGPGETLVRLRAAALNRRDVFVTRGLYPGARAEALPVILGSDGSGEVVAHGSEDAGGLPPEGSEVVINPALYWGDDERIPGRDYRILGLPDDGTFAQLVKVPSENVFEKPAHLTHEQAAAVPLAALTAYRALVTRGNLQPGETVVIPGVGGGVATFLVQLASALGGRVFVTSSSAEKVEKARELGAEGGVTYEDENWSRTLREMTGGVDLSVDSVGGEVFDALLALARPGSRIVTFGATASPKVSLTMPRVFLKQLDVLGTAMGTNREFEAMLKLYSEKGLEPLLDRTFPLEETPAAMNHMEEGSGMGKIVLEIPS